MENRNVMVSVIMLCYNHEKYIRKALDSVVNQITNFDYEIIVHDDKSTDNSAAIIKEYEEKYPDRIKAIYQEENQYSKKVLIRRTYIDPILRGKYVAFCECDDYWCDENKLQKQVDFLEANPEYVAAAHNCFLVDDDGNPLNEVKNIYRPYVSHRCTLRRLALGVGFPGQTASLICRRSVYEFETPEIENELYKLRISTGDKRLYFRLLLAGDIYCMGEEMSAHRVVYHGGDSWSAQNFGKNRAFERHVAAIDMRRFAKKCKKRFPNYGMIFFSGYACVKHYLDRKTEENRKVYLQFVKEHGGIAGAFCHLLFYGILTVPYYVIIKKETVRYNK